MTSTTKQPSSVQASLLNPLTTIFTPPVGCFDKYYSTVSTIWHGCLEGYCYWTRPPACYPTSSYVVLATISWDGTTVSYPGIYAYSPGVLPSGFVQIEGEFASSDAIRRRQVSSLTTSNTLLPGASTTFLSPIPWPIVPPSSAIACLSGWTLINRFLCGQQMIADYITTSAQTAHGPIIALLPHIQVLWNTTDLAHFEPTSAPLLGSSLLASYERKEAKTAASLTTIASTSSFTLSYHPTTISSSTVASTTSSHHNLPATQSTTANPARPTPSGLSTGAKAGIGVGIAVGVLALLLLGFLILRNQRRRKTEIDGGTFVDSKAELPGDQKQRSKSKPAELAGRSRSELPSQEPQELEANNDPQEIGTTRSHIIEPEPGPISQEPLDKGS